MATLFIKHALKRDKHGVRLVATKQTSTATITAVYEGGEVRVASGDVWAAKQLPNGNYETIKT